MILLLGITCLNVYKDKHLAMYYIAMSQDWCVGITHTIAPYTQNIWDYY